jgi:Tfp pilus assembly ATPase PilU
MQTLDQCLVDLVKKGSISPAEAKNAAVDKTLFP